MSKEAGDYKGYLKSTISTEPLRYTSFIYDHPIITMLASCFLCIALTAITFLTWEMELATSGNFEDRDNIYSIERHAVRGLKLNDVLDNEAYPHQSINQRSLYAVFKEPLGTSPEDYNVFTPKRIQIMYDFQKLITDDKDYKTHCLIQKTTTNLAVQDDENCVEPYAVFNFLDFQMDEDGLPKSQEVINEQLEVYASFSEQLSFVGKDFTNTSVKTHITLLTIPFGFPLYNFTNYNAREDCVLEVGQVQCPYVTNSNGLNQRDLHDQWILTFSSKIPSFISDHEDEMEILYWENTLGNAVIEQVVWGDIMLFTFSALAILIVLLFLTKSLFLSSLGFFHIMLAFPTAFFFYVTVFQLKIFTQLCMCALFVMAAVGADDVLVTVDAYKQSLYELSKEDYEDPHRRFAWMFRRTAKAMLVTSLTTCAAFYSSAVLSVPAMKAFGLYAGSTVLINYLLVISWFVAVLAIWHKMQWDQRWCFQSRPEDVTVKENTLRFVERFYQDKVAVFVFQYRFYLIGFCGSLFVLQLAFSTQLQPQEGSSSALGDDFWVIRMFDLLDNAFHGDDTESGYEESFFYGVSGIDRSGIDMNSEDEDGTIVYDADFDPESDVVQEFMVNACDIVRTNGKSEYLQTSDGNFEISCMMQQFRDWRLSQNLSFPLGNSIHESMKEWITDGTSEYGAARPYEYRQSDNIGFENDKIIWWKFTANSTLFSESIPTSTIIEHLDYWETVEELLNKAAPAGANQCFQQLAYLWMWGQIKLRMVIGTFSGMGISLAIAFAVLIASTGNWITSSLALFTIFVNAVAVTGFIVMLGWKLDFTESICLQVLIGMSVDYVVHFAVAYNESMDTDVQQNRFLKVQKTLEEMGVSITGGMVTTLSTTVFLFPAKIMFLRRFGMIIFFSTCTSYFFSHLLFMPLLSVLGPVGGQGVIKRLKKTNNITKNKTLED